MKNLTNGIIGGTVSPINKTGFVYNGNAPKNAEIINEYKDLAFASSDNINDNLSLVDLDIQLQQPSDPIRPTQEEAAYIESIYMFGSKVGPGKNISSSELEDIMNETKKFHTLIYKCGFDGNPKNYKRFGELMSKLAKNDPRGMIDFINIYSMQRSNPLDLSRINFLSLSAVEQAEFLKFWATIFTKNKLNREEFNRYVQYCSRLIGKKYQDMPVDNRNLFTEEEAKDLKALWKKVMV